jgi:hypothetical protein
MVLPQSFRPATLLHTALLVSALLPVPAFAEGRVSPVAISADVVDADPKISTNDFGGHKAWSIIWPRDAAGRELRVGFIEELRLPYAEHPQEMMDFAHDSSADEPAGQTLDLPGRTEALWGRQVHWLLMSERAVMEPDSKKPETVADGKLHRGQDRRTCAVFTTDPAPRVGTLVGCFCRDLPPGTKIDEATARQWLEDIDLRIP